MKNDNHQTLGCWTKLKKNLFITTERLYMGEVFFVVPAN